RGGLWPSLYVHGCAALESERKGNFWNGFFSGGEEAIGERASGYVGCLGQDAHGRNSVCDFWKTEPCEREGKNTHAHTGTIRFKILANQSCLGAVTSSAAERETRSTFT
ncbi:unnamed protein product, partial [Ectocarpus sp. 8 AP-2014]